MTIRSLRAVDINAVVEFSVRAWRPVFESFMQVMGAEIFSRRYPHWEAIQAAAACAACQDENNRAWVAEAPAEASAGVALPRHPMPDNSKKCRAVPGRPIAG